VSRLGVVIAALWVWCGTGNAADLVVGMPNWPSGQAGANIIKYSVEKQFGLQVDVREMGTLTIFAGLDSGEVDIHPEVWLPNFDSLVKKYRDEKGSVRLSPKSGAATQGVCVTRETADKHAVRDIHDLVDTAKAATFDTDGDGKGEIWIGAQTWSSTAIERIRAKSYGYAETMKLLEMPEDVAMAAVDAAVATGRPIVFYCYRPHHIFTLHDIVQLSEPPHDDSKWNVVLPPDDPEWLQKSDAPVAWADSRFHIAFSTSMAERLPDVASFLSNIEFTTEEIVDMTYALQVERRPPGEYAQEWVAGHQDRLEGWSK
jgi:glycine betaine/proline transport system substrate-binding protein